MLDGPSYGRWRYDGCSLAIAFQPSIATTNCNGETTNCNGETTNCGEPRSARRKTKAAKTSLR
jgi:hypothetical protein